MGTSGPATAAPRKRDSRTGAESAARWCRAAAVVVACCVAGVGLAACSSGPMKMGTPPAIDRLGELKAGVSTSKDVVAVLGEPQGRGAARSPGFGLKESWLYESYEIDGAKARMRMLMVFLDKDTGVYQGHMWMASGMLFGQTR